MTLQIARTLSHPRKMVKMLGLCLLGLFTACAQNDTTGSTVKGSGTGPLAITLDKASLSFTAVKGAATLPSTNLNAQYGGDGVVIGVPPGTSPATWIKIETGSLSIGKVGYIVSVTTTNMSVGTYTTTLRFSTSRSNGTEVVYVDLPVTYAITASDVVDEAAPATVAMPQDIPDQSAFAGHEAHARAAGMQYILWATPIRK